MQPCRAVLARPRFRMGAVEQPVAIPIRGQAGRLAAQGILPLPRKGPNGLDHAMRGASAQLARSMRISSSLSSDHAPIVDSLSNTGGGRLRARDDDSVAGAEYEVRGGDFAEPNDDEDVAMGRSMLLVSPPASGIGIGTASARQGAPTGSDARRRKHRLNRTQLAAIGSMGKDTRPGSRASYGGAGELRASLASHGGRPSHGGLMTLRASLTGGLRAGSGRRPPPIHDADAAAAARSAARVDLDSDSDSGDEEQGMPRQPALYRGSVLDGTAPVGRVLLAIDGVGNAETAGRAAALRIGGSMAGPAARRALRHSVRAASRARAQAMEGDADADAGSSDEEGPATGGSRGAQRTHASVGVDGDDSEEEFLVGDARAASAPLGARRGRQTR